MKEQHTQDCNCPICNNSIREERQYVTWEELINEEHLLDMAKELF